MAVDVDASRLTEQIPISVKERDGGVDDDYATKRCVPRTQARGLRGAILGGVLGLALVGGLTGWLCWRVHQADQSQRLHDLFVQAGRQGAVNLTTIDYSHVDADIKRVLEGSAGAFYDEFEQRAPAFVDVVKKTQSKTEGAVTEAGIESIDGDSARVLVAVSVKTSNLAAPEQHPKQWRMRFDVQRVGDTAKVTNVGFVA